MYHKVVNCSKPVQSFMPLKSCITTQFCQELNCRKVTWMIVIFLLIHLFTFGLYGQKGVSITDIKQTNQSIFNHIEILCDTTGLLDINQIRSGKHKGRFSLLSRYTKDISSDYTYWLHFVIEGADESNVPTGLFIPKENHIVDIY